MSLLDLSRWQFAITVMFHMTFLAITVGVSILLSVLYGRHWRTGNPVYLQMFRFWRRIFAVGFAIGVVAGIVITFEMGLNWAIYAAQDRADHRDGGRHRVLRGSRVHRHPALR